MAITDIEVRASLASEPVHTEVKLTQGLVRLKTPIAFGDWDDSLSAEAKVILQEVAGCIKAVQQACDRRGVTGKVAPRFQVSGHTNGEHTDTNLRLLARKRAAAVGDYLVKLGCDPAQLETIGTDDDEDDSGTDEAKAYNRRVDVELFNPRQVVSALKNALKKGMAAGGELMLDDTATAADFAIDPRKVAWPPLCYANLEATDPSQRATDVSLHHVLVFRHLLHLWSTGHHEEMRKAMDSAAWITPNRLYRPYTHTPLPGVFSLYPLVSVNLRKAGKYCEAASLAREVAEEARQKRWAAEDDTRAQHMDFAGRVQRMHTLIALLKERQAALDRFMDQFAMNEGETNAMVARGRGAVGASTDGEGRTVHAYTIHKLQQYIEEMHASSSAWATPSGQVGNTASAVNGDTHWDRCLGIVRFTMRTPRSGARVE